MEGDIHQSRSDAAWELAERQHGVVARRQLLRLGFKSRAIERRLGRGRLHRVMPGIYAVGRPGLTRHGRWMAAVLACGSHAALSHGSAAALWRLGDERVEEGIPVSGPVLTLVDLAGYLPLGRLERAVNEADKRNLATPEDLRLALDRFDGRRGVGKLRSLLDRRTFRLSDSDLEVRFRPLARDAGLPEPLTKQWVNGFEVDFFWPDLGLVVETDGLRYHRTPSQQNRALVRDQAHTKAGMTPLRFSHEQIRYDPNHVRSSLSAVRSLLLKRLRDMRSDR